MAKKPKLSQRLRFICYLANMMKSLKNTALGVLAGLLLFGLASCEEDPIESPFTFTITAKVDNADFYLDSAYTFPGGQLFKFNLFHFYMNQIRLVNANGNEVMISDVELVTFATQPSYQITADVPVDDYVAVRFGVGLDSATNMSDPNTYPTNHPLSILAGTYWDWNTMYRFAMMEAIVDTGGSGTNFIWPITYHPGLNEQYREMDMPKVFSVVEGQPAELTLVLDVKDILKHPSDPIDVVANKSTHCATPAQIALAARIMDNFTLSFTLN